MSDLKISVITPSYNQGHYIEETIRSVILQNYPNIEYIVMDGGSTDNTVEIIEKYQNQITYWESKSDRGQTHAINKGFEQATGDIISWLNSDDKLCDNALKAIADHFRNNPDSMWVAGNEIFMTHDGVDYIRKHPNTSRWLEKHCMMSVYQPNVFLRREVLDIIGYPKEDFHMAMDLEWFCRIAQRFPIALIEKDISRFRWHDNSKSSQGTTTNAYKRYQEEIALIVKQHHPSLRLYFNRWPKFSLLVWTRFQSMARLCNRILKKELWKINDSSV